MKGDMGRYIWLGQLLYICFLPISPPFWKKGAHTSRTNLEHANCLFNPNIMKNQFIVVTFFKKKSFIILLTACILKSNWQITSSCYVYSFSLFIVSQQLNAETRDQELKQMSSIQRTKNLLAWEECIYQNIKISLVHSVASSSCCKTNLPALKHSKLPPEKSLHWSYLSSNKVQLAI